MKIKTRRYYIYYLVKAGFFLLSLIPLRISLRIADTAGKIVFRYLKKYRNIAIENLRGHLPEECGKAEAVAEGMFRNLAKNGAEWVKLYTMPPRDLGKIVTSSKGFHHLDRVLKKGKGALVLGFHFGNWELLGIYLRHRGYAGSLVARRIYFHKYDRFIVDLRNKFSAETIYRDESPRKMLRLLKQGNILGIVPDQDMSAVEGVFVDFFGEKALTPVAPVKLAMAAGTSIVPIFVVRKPDDTNMVVVEEPIEVLRQKGDNGEAVKKFTQEWTSLLEKYVKMYPEQWVWLHRRWKTRPGDARQKEKIRG
jgi:KDO2-lipid IV(A) lauroyltransferase